MTFEAGAPFHRFGCWVLAVGLFAATGDAAHAQGIGLTTGSKKPVVIEADKGVEWHQKEQFYRARGNATAIQGDTRIRADRLTAYYHKGTKGSKGTQIWKVTANGAVKITTPKQTITAQHAVYIVKTGVFTLTGNNLKMATEKQTVTARDKIEYNSKTKVAHVVGDAVVVENKKRVRADRFVAYLEQNPGDKKTELKRVVAFGNVMITTENEVLRGDRGDYNGKTKIATLTGNVKLTRGDNQLNGEKAVVDLNTGVSRMVGRVQGVFIPREGEEKKRQESERKAELKKTQHDKKTASDAKTETASRHPDRAERGRVSVMPSSRPRRR
jgi:lipopolysaccharide export system protein LptA